MPETVLDRRGPQNAFIHSKYTFRDVRIQERLNHIDVASKQFPRQLPRLIESIHEELSLVSEETLPQEFDEYREVCVTKTCMKMVIRMVCRACVGLPLC